MSVTSTGTGNTMSDGVTEYEQGPRAIYMAAASALPAMTLSNPGGTALATVGGLTVNGVAIQVLSLPVFQGNFYL